LIFLSFILHIGLLLGPKEAPKTIPNFCELQGAVYVEKQDRNFAQYSVYVEESESFAQMLVYPEDSRTYADRPGLWYFVENRGMANFIIYYEKEAGMADFSIFFTQTASFAGCQ
jgi:hypothetical protein